MGAPELKKCIRLMLSKKKLRLRIGRKEKKLERKGRALLIILIAMQN